MKTKKELVFVDETQKKVFDFISLVIKHVDSDDVTKHQKEIKAIVELPSIRKEYEMVQTFRSAEKAVINVSDFKTIAEFWLRTVYFKLEPKKIELLYKLAASMRKWNEDPANAEQQRKPVEFVLTALNTEPLPEKYVRNLQTEKTQKALAKVDFSSFVL